MSLKKFLLAGCLSVFCACFVAGCASEPGDGATDGGTSETEASDTNTTSPE